VWLDRAHAPPGLHPEDETSQPRGLWCREMRLPYRRQMSDGSRMQQHWTRPVWDVVLAGVCLQLALSLTIELTQQTSASVRSVALGLATAHAATLVGRRRWPEAVTAVLVLTAVAYRLLGLAPMFLGPASLIGLYTVTVRLPRSRSATWLAAAIVVAVAGGVGLLDWASLALNAGLVVGAWVLGDQVARRQAEMLAHAQRARELEEAREDLARSAVTQERLHIARELHDSVAHTMSVVALNAGTGRLVAEQDPTAAQQALERIENVARGALAEMRQLLAVLRDSDDPLSPLPGMEDVPGLIARTAEAGLAVDVRIEGQPRPLTAGVDLAVYRIVQEALTNTVKHSKAASATVRILFEESAVTVKVDDPGPPRPADAAGSGTGSGLVGMRERVALHGGELRAGPSARGFSVRARLPAGGAP
jgi:signal transduction histidine kinase